MDIKLQQGRMMSAMRKAGNSISYLQFEINGKIYPAEELADLYDEKEAQERPPEESQEVKDRRRQGLEFFKQQDFVAASSVFSKLAGETGLRKDWFNLFSACLYLGEKEKADQALREMRSCPVLEKLDNCLSPAEEGFHAARLYIENGHSKSGASELLKLAECYKVSADGTFLYIRRVPLFENVIPLVDALESALSHEDWKDFLASFSASIGQEARDLLRNRKRNLDSSANGETDAARTAAIVPSPVGVKGPPSFDAEEYQVSRGVGYRLLFKIVAALIILALGAWSYLSPFQKYRVRRVLDKAHEELVSGRMDPKRIGSFERTLSRLKDGAELESVRKYASSYSSAYSQSGNPEKFATGVLMGSPDLSYANGIGRSFTIPLCIMLLEDAKNYPSKTRAYMEKVACTLLPKATHQSFGMIEEAFVDDEAKRAEAIQQWHDWYQANKQAVLEGDLRKKRAIEAHLDGQKKLLEGLMELNAKGE